VSLDSVDEFCVRFGLEEIMKPKNLSGRGARKGAAAVDGSADAQGRAVVIDFIQGRIEAFNHSQGGGVCVRKDRGGYSLIREDNGIPVARLRPQELDKFEILSWSRSRERWQRVGEWGVTASSLDEALDFISRDPYDCFWT
jgi:hypothetical protein